MRANFYFLKGDRFIFSTEEFSYLYILYPSNLTYSHPFHPSGSVFYYLLSIANTSYAALSSPYY
jgi:hypothetical protein